MSRIEEEKRVVEQMIRLYCRKCEGHDELCPSCKELLDYAHSRLESCRYGEQKPTYRISNDRLHFYTSLERVN